MQLIKKLSAMVKPQIVVRLSPELLEKLNKYAEQTGASKTDVVVGALSHYLGCAEALPLKQVYRRFSGNKNKSTNTNSTNTR
jgi:predicted DNA-binding protein